MTIREDENATNDEERYEFGFKTMEDYEEETGQTFKEVTQPDGTVQMVAAFKTVPEKNPYQPKKVWKASALQAACNAAFFECPNSDCPHASGASTLSRIITAKFFSKGISPGGQVEDEVAHGESVASLTKFICHTKNPLCTAVQAEAGRFTSDANTYVRQAEGGEGEAGAEAVEEEGGLEAPDEGSRPHDEV